MKKTINQCLCCSSRRHFLSSFLPAAVAFTVLQSATPAKAEVNQAQALVISCIDFRFLRAEYSFLNNKNLIKILNLLFTHRTYIQSDEMNDNIN